MLARLALFVVYFWNDSHGVIKVHFIISVILTIPKKVSTSISPLLPVSASLHLLWTSRQHDRIWERSLLSMASEFNKVLTGDCLQTAEEGLSCSGPKDWTRKRFSSINLANVMLLLTVSRVIWRHVCTKRCIRTPCFSQGCRVLFLGIVGQQQVCFLMDWRNVILYYLSYRLDLYWTSSGTHGSPDFHRYWSATCCTKLQTEWSDVQLFVSEREFKG